jgi:hypothetical protein
MNRIIRYFLIGLIAASCTQSNSIDQQLPGKYARGDSDRYAIFTDTLIFSKKPGQGENVFTVESRSVTRQLDDNDKPGEPQFEKEPGTAIYHPDKKLLERLPDGQHYSVDLEKGIITNGEVTFKRVE